MDEFEVHGGTSPLGDCSNVEPGICWRQGSLRLVIFGRARRERESSLRSVSKIREIHLFLSSFLIDLLASRRRKNSFNSNATP